MAQACDGSVLEAERGLLWLADSLGKALRCLTGPLALSCSLWTGIFEGCSVQGGDWKLGGSQVSFYQ